MRGKLAVDAASARNSRITPAGAGKTRAFCGCYGAAEGSPPQVRGKQLVTRCNDKVPRITPAGAGKTYLKISFLSVLQDHPRRCGENAKNEPKQAHAVGSPPQVRGKLEFETRLPFESGITPAGAGKT